MALYDRNIAMPENQLTEVDVHILYPLVKAKVVSELPAWFVDSVDVNGFSTFWDVTPPISGTYYYQVDIYTLLGVLIETYTLTIEVGDVYENVDNCCSDANINIVWINRQGGRGNFIFTQRKDFTVEIGSNNTFVSNHIKRYSEINGVYNGKIVYSSGITQTMVDFLDTLRYSIQSWIFNAADATFTPILVDVGSFTKYTTKENLYEVNISFIYAEELQIQRQ